jgi:hypothetical protein
MANDWLWMRNITTRSPNVLNRDAVAVHPFPPGAPYRPAASDAQTSSLSLRAKTHRFA